MFGWFGPPRIPEPSKQQIRDKCQILFIDDDTDFDIVEILKRQGWKASLLPDVSSWNNAQLKESHILFVDIRGVGQALRFDDEGLGLARALKREFPHKMVVIYSAERHGDRFHDALSEVDATLPKDAEPYLFEQTIEGLAKDCFSFSRVIERICKDLEREFPQLDPDVVRKDMARLVQKNRVTGEEIGRKLSIGFDKAGSLASILSLVIS